METLVAKDFNDSVREMSDDLKKEVFNAFSSLESSRKENILSKGVVRTFSADEGEGFIYQMRLPNSVVYFTFANKNGDEDLVLLDATAINNKDRLKGKRSMFQRKKGKV
ncbi:hypothetical protein [Vreelandella gomseomensis]|uniref:Uncharacterized protein n=1 Tax=Vreelandella gomseomensis TaxID=370766 RepID=A0ABU1GCB5_9GAMM|nr:hypothetical protein [Halomonas gomseomensis]MDR5875118.1 hypothetical protein [Halomonas gomseomensis]